MSNELGLIATNDLAAITRGRAMQVARLEQSLDAGCGWVPANLGIGPFGHIVETGEVFGSTGDLRLIPDPATRTEFVGHPGHPPLTVMLANTTHTDGSPWPSCPRTFLREAIRDLKAETGLQAWASFEHEFFLRSDAAPSAAFSIARLLEGEPFGSSLIAAVDRAGFEPENWLPEYGAHQWEIVLAAAGALEAADRAILLRDLVRYVAKAHGREATFVPLLDPGDSGSGVHLHLSLRTDNGVPAMFDAARPGRLSVIAGQFAAGVLDHCRALTALTASSVVSYQRLTPHRWSAAHAFLGERNREALLRICPTVEVSGKDPAAQFNIEYRAGDATANPWLYLGAILRAGLDGIRRELPAPTVLDIEVDGLSMAEREEAGVRTLPHSLAEALEALDQDATVAGWFAPELLATFKAIKAEEVATMNELDDAAVCAAYADVY